MPLVRVGISMERDLWVATKREAKRRGFAGPSAYLRWLLAQGLRASP